MHDFRIYTIHTRDHLEKIIDTLSKVSDETGNCCIVMECIRRRHTKCTTVSVIPTLFANSTLGMNYAEYRSRCLSEKDSTYEIYFDGKLEFSRNNLFGDAEDSCYA